jgi:hypothetical protein
MRTGFKIPAFLLSLFKLGFRLHFGLSLFFTRQKPPIDEFSQMCCDRRPVSGSSPFIKGIP